MAFGQSWRVGGKKACSRPEEGTNKCDKFQFIKILICISILQ
jgi:hypothetical protein